MKIATVIGIFGLVGATAMVGCSGNSTPTGFGTDNTGNGSSSGSTGGSSGDTSSSGSSGASSGGSSSGTSSGIGSSGASSGTGSSSGTSSGVADDAGGIVTTDAAPGNDPETDYSRTKTVTMDPFTVQPGGEVYMCQHFKNPWGAQVDIKTYSLDMATGSHHMFAFYDTANTNGAVGACPAGGNTFGAFTFTSQSQQVTQTYPATVGATIPASTGFNMMVHYLNTGATPIQSSVKLTMYVARPNVVTNHAGVIFLNNVAISVPPGVSQQTAIPWTLPQDVNIMFSSSHMHKQATNFVSTAGSTQLFTTTEWAEPTAKQYSPPLLVKKGTAINWTCTYNNTTNKTLTFGESAQSNVMCISTSIFYPVADVTNPVLGSALAF